MAEWARKRFWSTVATEAIDEGYLVTLDGRPLRTPARQALAVPSLALAERIAAEWGGQPEVFDPATMPATRTANSAIDKVRGQQGEVAALVSSYGDSDLICYRATAPRELVAREAAAWDPLVAWADARFGARLTVWQGVMHHAQPPEALQALHQPVAAMSAFELAAFHDLVALSGSLVIGLAVREHLSAPELLWEAAQVDEAWQIEQWGEDAEASALTLGRNQAFLDAARFIDCLHTG